LTGKKGFSSSPVLSGERDFLLPAVKEIQSWKQENTGTWNEHISANPFISKLQFTAENIYQDYRIYGMPWPKG